jgi:hypothetical protein
MVPTSSYPVSTFPPLAGTSARKFLAAFTTIFFAASCIAQNQAQPQAQSNALPDAQSGLHSQANPQSSSLTLPAGTRIPLMLTHDIQSRSMHRGDPIYAQITSPVNMGDQVIIPPGAFVQGTVDKLERKAGRAELHLQSISMTFPDGYVASVPGPVTLESDDGYALPDPSQKRVIGFVALPAAGAGLGALIGHSLASSQSSTLTNTLPPGCTGVPPECLTSSVSVPGSKAKDTVIGAMVGTAIGAVASFALFASSHGFFIDVGTPVEMVLQKPLSLPQNQAASAVRDSEQHPVAIQPVASRPVPPAPPDPGSVTTDHGTCYTPGSPGTPDTVIPGPPGPDGTPGPSTTIPGIPATPPTPYPCP